MPSRDNILWVPRYTAAYYSLNWPNPENTTDVSGYYYAGDLNRGTPPVNDWAYDYLFLNFAAGHIGDDYYGAWVARSKSGDTVYSGFTIDAYADIALEKYYPVPGGTYQLKIRGTFHNWGGADPTYRKLYMLDESGAYSVNASLDADEFTFTADIDILTARRLMGINGRETWHVGVGENGDTNPPTVDGWYGLAIWSMGVTSSAGFVSRDPGTGLSGGGGTNGVGADNWQDAASIDSIPYRSAQTDNTNYTTQAGETDVNAKSAWWKFTATQTQTLSADLFQSAVLTGGGDTIMAVYSVQGTPTSLADLTEVAFNDDSDQGVISAVTFDVVAGTTYYIQAGSYGDSESLKLVLNIVVGGEPGGGGGGGGTSALTIEGHRSIVAFNVATGYAAIPPILEVGVSTPLADNEDLPTEVELVIAGAQPGEVVTLVATNTASETDPDLHEVDLGTATVDSEGNLGPFSVMLTEDVASLPGFIGQPFYIKATGANGYGYATLIYLGTPVSVVGSTNPGIDAAPVHIPDSNGRWVFQDLKPGGLGSWVMDIGPSSMTPPHLAKVVNVQHTTNPEVGQFHISESNLDSPDWTLTGFCPNQAFYDRLVAYSELNRRFYVIDHRGRAWKVAAQNLQLTPRNRKTLVLPGQVGTWEDWMNDYQLTLAIYGQEFVIP